jgi:hypothetical protein
MVLNCLRRPVSVDVVALQLLTIRYILMVMSLRMVRGRRPCGHGGICGFKKLTIQN